MSTEGSVATDGRRVAAHIQTIVTEAHLALRRIYAERFLGLILFGSHARGTATSESDIDLLLLLQDCGGIAERSFYSPVIDNLSLKHDVVISVVPMELNEYELGDSPFIMNVRKEGVRL